MIEIPIIPVSKPRMTRKDRYNPSKAASRYWEFKDELNITHIKEANKCRRLLCDPYKIIFVLPMPRSWGKKKKQSHKGQPHRQKPDKDNLEKAFLDAIFSDDSMVWSGWAEKIWGYEGKIIVKSLIV